MTGLGMILPLALAALSPALGFGWLGHGVYKLALLGMPFSGDRRPWLNGAPALTAAVNAGVLGAALGGIGLSMAWLASPSTWDPAAMRAALDARFAFTPATVLVAAILIATANAGLEEWFYRAWLDVRIGATGSALVFGLQHVVVLAPLAGISAATIAGVLLVPAALSWSYMAERHGWALSTLSHIVADVVLFAGGLRLLGYWS